MDYRKTKPDYEKHPELKGASGDELFMFIKDRYMNIKKQLFGKAGNGYLPEQVSLLEGFILLLALDDDISKLENGNHVDKLKRIRSMVFLRKLQNIPIGCWGKNEFAVCR